MVYVYGKNILVICLKYYEKKYIIIQFYLKYDQS